MQISKQHVWHVWKSHKGLGVYLYSALQHLQVLVEALLISHEVFHQGVLLKRQTQLSLIDCVHVAQRQVQHLKPEERIGIRHLKHDITWSAKWSAFAAFLVRSCIEKGKVHAMTACCVWACSFL